MGATPVCQITDAGCIRPDFAAVLAYIQGAYRSIYGQDVYLGADCQDGQFLVLLANAIHDGNGQTLTVYNSFSPAIASGVPLDRIVKINNIRRKRATYSVVPLRIVGQAGSQILGGAVRDPSGNVWSLPSSVVIPDAGEIIVAATCQTIGAVQLSTEALNTDNGLGAIATPTLGWQSAENIAAASIGQPVEPDSALRQRQSLSTALPSQTLVDGLTGALAALTNVNRLAVYENDDGVPDADGLPGHSIAVVVDGGDPQAIADLIRLKKGPGISTYGATVVSTTSASGVQKDVAFFYLAPAPVGFAVTVRSLGGYTLGIEAQIKAAPHLATQRLPWAR